VFVLLDVTALFLPGAPPKASDSAAQIAGMLAAHRSELMAGTYVAGLALIALVFFLGALRSWLRRLGADPGLAFAASGGALLAMAAQVTGLTLFDGATFKVAGQHQDALVRALTDGGNAAVELGKFGFAAFIAAVCIAVRRALAPRFIAVGWVAVALLLASAVALVSEAPIAQVGGGLDMVGSVPAVLWIGALAILVFRRGAKLPAVARVPAPAGGTT
jgi:hypothetical protein